MEFRRAVAAIAILVLPLAADGYKAQAAREHSTLTTTFDGFRPADLRVGVCRAIAPWLRLRRASDPKQRVVFDTRTSIQLTDHPPCAGWSGSTGGCATCDTTLSV